MIIKRDYYLNQLIGKEENKRVKVVTGIKRVGKSYLLNKLFYNYLIESGVNENQIIVLRLDELSNIKYRNPIYLNEYLNSSLVSNKMNYIFIDEIQFVEKIRNPYINDKDSYISFYEVLNELLNKDNVDVYVTGSNSKMLSSDVLTEFRGRGDQIHLMPLSIYELSNFSNLSFDDLYNEYQTYGGLPYVWLIKNEEGKSEYLKKLFNETYLVDVIERNKLTNTNELDQLVNVLASSIGSLTNPTKIENTFKSELKSNYARSSIVKHIEYLKQSFIISEANRFDIKGRKYIGANSKYYFSDVGIRNAKLNFRQQEPTHLMENIIYNQLIMLGYNVDVGVVEINEKVGDAYKRKQLEIDFVISKGDLKLYIQSAYKMDDSLKQKQEKRAFLGIDDSFKKIVIVKDNFKPWYDDNGILILSLKDFLLSLDILK